MKFKYYLRGLGIGVLVTAVLMSIGNGVSSQNKKSGLTDAQVIERAKTLGMKTQDEYDKVEQDLKDSEKSITDLEDRLKNNQAAPESEDGSQKEASDDKEEADKEKEPENSTAGKEQGVEIRTDIEFNITQGMDSEQVAQALEKKGIIVSASDFNSYLVESGYANSIQIGSYKANEGESYDSIIKKITGR